ncbi:LysR family transcriptional regulator [Acinetobacter stercoris]|uniref:Glycine cleavage system transcriptional activator n=1 Tax=Acinetobacter stercoris TaxID=2126983 RepID=A0A2U3MZ21_9GAMM|nr:MULTISPECIES: LysR substrate-binding domain-containing protein [Acinetobacter]SPL70670.1 Glycine cleavage system transcriptional activator [Acinetobacter stercoris]
MVDLHHCLDQLLAFQYVAENLSFKKASDQLFLTPTALSHRIKKLEQQLNLKLFERRTRTIVLTPEGEYLYKHVQLGFNQIHKALEELQQKKQRMLTITTTPPYASEWIIPYLPELQALFPQVIFRVHASYDPVNMDTGQYDLAIRYGQGGYRDLNVELLAEDEYVAVSHAFFDEALLDWSKVPLIHFSWGEEYCPLKVNWQTWYKQQDMQIAAGQRQVFYNEENHAIQAVLAGQGIALLSRIAVSNYLKHGTLKIVSPHVLSSMNYYFLTTENEDDVVTATKTWCREKLYNVLC